MRFLIIILVIACSVTSYSQNYNCLQFGPKSYFINGNGYVRGIRVDSIQVIGSDTVYFPYHSSRIKFGTAIIDSFSGSWLGKNVVKQADGTYLFDNLFDTITIKTMAHIGDSWIFYDDSSIFSYLATVTAQDTMTIAGTIDSIKKITVSAYKAGIANPLDPVNNFQIFLSKHNGFEQIFDLYTFPYHRPDTFSFNPPAFEYNIRGFDDKLDFLLNNLCMPDLCCHDNPPDTFNSVFHQFAFHNPTLMEVYSANIGDVYEDEFTAADNGGLPGIVNELFTIDSVLTKTILPHNVVYTGSENKMGIKIDFSVLPPHFDTSYDAPHPFSRSGTDTNFLMNPNAMPEETKDGYMLHYFPDYSIIRPSSCIHSATYIFPSNAGCEYNGIASVPIADSVAYSIGFGMSDNTYCRPYGICQHQGCIYCYKDGIPCGSFVPIVPHNTSVAPIMLSKTISISPNPATTQITITTNSPFSTGTWISVYDVTARCIVHESADRQSNFIINTTTWTNGLYLVLVQDNTGIILKQKEIIMH